jgi:hypothetical protein
VVLEVGLGSHVCELRALSLESPVLLLLVCFFR